MGLIAAIGHVLMGILVSLIGFITPSTTVSVKPTPLISKFSPSSVPSPLTTSTPKQLIAKLGALMPLPSEQPLIASVIDITKLPKLPLYAKAQIGDRVILYQKAQEAILYRESLNKVINIETFQPKAAYPSISPSTYDAPTPYIPEQNYGSYDNVMPTQRPVPTIDMGTVNLHPDYTGGYTGYDSNGNKIDLHPNYAGGYSGYDTSGTHYNVNPDYTGGYTGYGSNGSNIHLGPDYSGGLTGSKY